MLIARWYLAQSPWDPIKRVVSSAYCLMNDVILWQVVPWAPHLRIEAASPWTTKVNNRGNRLSPCLPPPVKGKGSDKCPFNITRASVSLNPN